MKQLILGTILGRIGLSMRDSINLARTAYVCPEAVGTLANDVLARILVTKLCRNDKIFVDIGAHIGSVVAEVNYCTPSVRIVAFEAIPEKVAFLRRKPRHVEFRTWRSASQTGKRLSS